MEGKLVKIRNYSREAYLAFSKTDPLHGRSSKEHVQWVGWSRPQQGWAKLNTDGCSRGDANHVV